MKLPTGTWEESASCTCPGTDILCCGPRRPEIDSRDASGHCGDQVVKVRWHENTVFIPPTDWYHQHFNPTNTPAKFLKVASFESRIYPITASDIFKEHGNVISYESQDPKINEIFIEELKKNGIVSAMPTVEEIQKKANNPKH